MKLRHGKKSEYRLFKEMAVGVKTRQSKARAGAMFFPELLLEITATGFVRSLTEHRIQPT